MWNLMHCTNTRFLFLFFSCLSLDRCRAQLEWVYFCIGGKMGVFFDDDDVFYRTTGSPQAKSPAGSSAGALQPTTPTAPANKALQNVKGDHPSVIWPFKLREKGRNYLSGTYWLKLYYFGTMLVSTCYPHLLNWNCC